VASLDDVVLQARTWLNTPYHHQGRLKGVGVDCAGLIIGVAHELGLSDFEIGGYTPRPDGDSLRRACQAQMRPLTLDELAPGDVLLFRFDAHPGHLGFLSGPQTLLHAYLPRRKVVEHGLDAAWWRQVVGCYRLPGVY
jgi:NlpC/P60 family putative phage cell wall peptidase